MGPAIPIRDPCRSIIAHHTSAAGVPVVKFDIPRKKNHPASLELLFQKLSEVSNAMSQLIFDCIFQADAVGFVVVEYNPVLGIGHVLNEACENSSTAEVIDGCKGWHALQRF